MKVFADDKFNMVQTVKFVLGRIANIVGKGENAGLKSIHKYSSYGSEVYKISLSISKAKFMTKTSMTVMNFSFKLLMIIQECRLEK